MSNLLDDYSCSHVSVAVMKFEGTALLINGVVASRTFSWDPKGLYGVDMYLLKNAQRI